MNNYSPKWLVVDIYRAAKRRGKYPLLATDTEVNSIYSNSGIIYTTITIYLNDFFTCHRCKPGRHFSSELLGGK